MVTQQFHETLEPLSEWLGATEKHLANSEPIGTETAKLDDQISQHKVISIICGCSYHPISFCPANFSFINFAHPFKFVLFIISHMFFITFSVSYFGFVCVFSVCVILPWFFSPIPCGQALEEEIMNHSKDLLHAVSLGQKLKSVSPVDEKESVQSKVDSTQARCIELQERCRRKAEMLQQALANAQVFGEDKVALMNWLNEVYSKLSQVSVEDYKIEVLEKQLAEQWVYTLRAMMLSFYLSCINHVPLDLSDV